MLEIKKFNLMFFLRKNIEKNLTSDQCIKFRTEFPVDLKTPYNLGERKNILN